MGRAELSEAGLVAGRMIPCQATGRWMGITHHFLQKVGCPADIHHVVMHVLLVPLEPGRGLTSLCLLCSGGTRDGPGAGGRVGGEGGG